MKELRRENLYYPFVNYGQYKLAESLAIPTFPSEERVRRFAVNGRGSFLAEDVAFDSVNAFYACFDELASLQYRWAEKAVNDPEDLSYPEIRYWFRDSLAVLQEILENPALASQCIWAPKKEYNAEGDRVYTDMHSGDFWWDAQVLILISKTKGLDRERYLDEILLRFVATLSFRSSLRLTKRFLEASLGRLRRGHFT
jgi:hypothetical protein